MNLPNKENFLKEIILKNFNSDKKYNFVDATCGNGHDSLFLATNFKNSVIYALDIQQEALNNSKILCSEFNNIVFKEIDHLKFFDNINTKFDFIIFNTGFLPNSISNIKTDGVHTIKTLKSALKSLKNGSFLAITIYQGHDNGNEHKLILNFLKDLNKYEFIVFTYQTINTNLSPVLYLIEKK